MMNESSFIFRAYLLLYTFCMYIEFYTRRTMQMNINLCQFVQLCLGQFQLLLCHFTMQMLMLKKLMAFFVVLIYITVYHFRCRHAACVIIICCNICVFVFFNASELHANNFRWLVLTWIWHQKFHIGI